MRVEMVSTAILDLSNPSQRDNAALIGLVYGTSTFLAMLLYARAGGPYPAGYRQYTGQELQEFVAYHDEEAEHELFWAISETVEARALVSARGASLSDVRTMMFTTEGRMFPCALDAVFAINHTVMTNQGEPSPDLYAQIVWPCTHAKWDFPLGSLETVLYRSSREDATRAQPTPARSVEDDSKLRLGAPERPARMTEDEALAVAREVLPYLNAFHVSAEYGQYSDIDLGRPAVWKVTARGDIYVPANAPGGPGTFDTFVVIVNDATGAADQILTYSGLTP